jgi:hypothetical protein
MLRGDDLNPVTQPLPGTTSPVTIGGYQVIVERDSRKSPIAFSVTLPPTVTRVTVPANSSRRRREYLFEVLAIRDKSGNQNHHGRASASRTAHKPSNKFEGVTP